MARYLSSLTAQRAAALILWIVGLAMFAIGVAVNLPWLIAENSRLEPWKVPVLWLSEITALAMFLEYGVRQILGDHPDDRTHGLTVKAFLVATLLDCGLSAVSIAEEDAAHARAVRCQATVVRGHTRLQNTGHTRYTFTCVFRDQQGVRHTGWFSNVNEDVPNDVRTAIVRRQLPTQVGIAYDPIRPARNWLADAPYSHDNRLFIFSLMTILHSALFAAVLAICRRGAPWLPSPRVAPLLGVIWILGMAAVFQGGW